MSTGRQESSVDMIKLRALEDWELAFVKYLLEGRSAAQAGVLVMERFPDKDLKLTERNSQRLAHREHIKLALQQSRGIVQQTATLVEEYQSERVRSMLPEVTQAAIENLSEGLAGIQEGIASMRAIIKGDAAPSLKIGALGQLTKTVQAMVQLSGVMQTERTLHGQERQTTAQGMSDALYNQIMGNVLVDMEVEPEGEAVEAETVEAAPVEVSGV